MANRKMQHTGAFGKRRFLIASTLYRYSIRNAIVSMLASIVCHLVQVSDDETMSNDDSRTNDNAAATRTQFQDILEERVHDVASCVD